MEPEKIDPNELSQRRTEMSVQRTDMSTHRTDMSEERTDLSVARSHLANERTHLSYLRTGVALISFGVTLNRFALYLLQSEEMERFHRKMFLHDLKNVGIGMVLLGSILLAWSIRHFIKIQKSIENLSFVPAKWSLIFFSLAVICIGAVTTIWMILS
ncbi:DUF202 domain-containing protein [Bdellovibrio sp. 22V]|uniref:YidH family protein n=1 Tax=Bdellovibrio TaxID=958 RepID=UPI002542F5FC|nr:DUF202 domain-containing protein [Bdellovibrio sp. 22V]WII71605.1 DUF202 domain-containing protein [Bdellovibrio sp. 22V]